MEQTIKIEVPEGKKAVYNESTQTVEFVDIEPIRSKSWEEFCKNHPNVSNEEWCLDNQRGYIEHYGIKGCKRNNTHKLLMATKEDAEGILALIQLIRFHDEWVGDWKPVYNDVNKIWFIEHVNLKHGQCFNVQYTKSTSHLLSFPNSKMCSEFFICFEDLIAKAKKFI